MLIAYFALRASLLSEPLFCLVCFFVSCLSLGILRPEVASDFFGQLFCSYILISTHHLVHVADRLLLSNCMRASAVVAVELPIRPRNEDRQAEARCAVAVLQGHRG